MGAIGFGAVFSSFMTNYSESYIEDLTVDLTLKYFVNSKKDFKGLISKKIQNHGNLPVNQNTGLKTFQCVEFSVRETSQKPTIVSVICHP